MKMQAETDYTETVKKLLQVNMAAKCEESLLIVTDTEKTEIGNWFVKGGQALGLETVHIVMAPRRRSGCGCDPSPWP